MRHAPDCRRTAWLPAILIVLPATLAGWIARGTPQGGAAIDDVTGEYQFISADDTLALLDEEGKLKGYVDVVPTEEESDDVLTYNITIGSRQNNHVEFKTSKIHQKYYRFSGTARRGAGRRESDPDYLQLVGDLEIVTVHSDTGQESVEQRHVVLKSKGQAERQGH